MLWHVKWGSNQEWYLKMMTYECFSKKKNSNKVSTIICTLPRAKNPTLVEKQESKSEIWKEMGDDREEEDSE